jgi:hypothetical protein
VINFPYYGIKFLVNNESEILIRVFSQNLFKDSKYFEKVLINNVVSILRKVLKNNNIEIKDNKSDVLKQFYLVKYPELVEFTGNIIITLKDKSIINYANIKDGSYINSRTIEKINSINTSNIDRIITIENKANYYDYIQHKNDKELVFYLGGFNTPIQTKFLKKLNNVVDVYHWSDIDLGGFNIFVKLKETFKQLQPFLMDKKTLIEYKDMGMLITDNEYMKKVMLLKNDIRYEVFYEVIDQMNILNIRIEQECMIR